MHGQLDGYENGFFGKSRFQKLPLRGVRIPWCSSCCALGATRLLPSFANMIPSGSPTPCAAMLRMAGARGVRNEQAGGGCQCRVSGLLGRRRAGDS